MPEDRPPDLQPDPDVLREDEPLPDVEEDLNPSLVPPDDA